MTATEILKKISSLKKEINEITSMRSGSLSQQYNVCGSPGCKCKDAVSPKKHGPYFKLRTNLGGKPTTRFVRDQNVALVKKQLKNYKHFEKLVQEWVRLSNELAEIETSRISEKIKNL